MRDAWAGVDLGTQSARVVALADDGERLALVAAPLTSRRFDDRHEQDPFEWLQVVDTLLRRATAALPSGTAVRGVAVSGTSGTVVPLDPAGHPVGPAAMYDDRRGAARLGEVQAAGAAVWTRLGVTMQATWGLPKLLQMRSNAAPGTVFGHQPDVVAAHLTGGPVATDLSSALKTGADLDAIAWPADVLDALGLPVDALPPVTASGTVLGHVGARGAEATGLPVGCAVVAGSTDGCAAQFAAGALADGAWNSVLGTTLVLKGAAAERIPDPEGAVYAHRAPFDGGWLPGGASNTGAGAVSALLAGRDLDAATAAAAARSDVPVAWPLLTRGERFPFVDDAAEGFWPGGAVPEDDGALLRAITFGTAFLERLAFERLQDLGYPTGGPIFLTGGGARNAWWSALRARVLGRPVVLPAETEGAAGMAVLAAAACTGGEQPLRDAAARMLGEAVPVPPLELDDAALEDGYAAFVDRVRPRGADR